MLKPETFERFVMKFEILLNFMKLLNNVWGFLKAAGNFCKLVAPQVDARSNVKFIETF